NGITPGDLNLGTSRVAISATDGLGRMGQRTLNVDWVEAWNYRTFGQGEVTDCFPMAEAAAATSYRNITGSGTPKICPNNKDAGSYDLADASQGIMLPGAVALSAAGTLPSTTGPILGLDLGRTIGGGVLTFAFTTDSQCTAASPGGDISIAAGYDTTG